MRHPKRAITRDVKTRRPKRAGREAAELETARWPEDTVRVKDVMTRPVVTLRPEMLAGATVKAMAARRIRHAPVVDERGALVGIVTDRDLRVVLEPPVEGQPEALKQSLEALTVRDLMSWGPLTVKPEATIRDAARLLYTNKIGALPVVDGGRVVGILAATDVIRTLVRLLDEGVLSRPGRWGKEA